MTLTIFLKKVYPLEVYSEISKINEIVLITPKWEKKEATISQIFCLFKTSLSRAVMGE